MKEGGVRQDFEVFRYFNENPQNNDRKRVLRKAYGPSNTGFHLNVKISAKKAHSFFDIDSSGPQIDLAFYNKVPTLVKSLPPAMFFERDLVELFLKNRVVNAMFSMKGKPKWGRNTIKTNT